MSRCYRRCSLVLLPTLGLGLLSVALLSRDARAESAGPAQIRSAQATNTLGDLPTWSVGLGLGVGPLTLRGNAARALSGTSVEIWLATHRRFPSSRWAAFVELSGFVMDQPTYKSSGRDEKLAQTVAFGLTSGIGAAYVPNSRWAVTGSLGPTVVALASPRVFAASDWGLALSGSVTRVWPVGRGAAIGAALRSSLGTVGDGADEWSSFSATIHLLAQWRR